MEEPKDGSSQDFLAVLFLMAGPFLLILCLIGLVIAVLR
jgi:hypothetical protein